MTALWLLASAWLAAGPGVDADPPSFTVLYSHDREGALDPCG